MPKREPRGLRLNNPGNIFHSGSRWLGKSTDQPDPQIVKFDHPKWGLRALAVTIRTYQNVHGIDTILEFTKRYAPEEGGNPTGAYAIFLAGKVGVGPRAKVVLTSYPNLYRLIEGIIQFEQGVQPFTRAEINEGIRLAKIPVPEGEE